MPDVIHDPETDWCACESHGPARCDFRLLADTIIDQLNPPDGDDAEVAICMRAIARVAEFARSQPCTCPRRPAADPCDRCAVLGQYQGQAVDR
jgi:hypothetical protein